MKTLVVFYSRTGRTRKVATELAHALNAELDELHETCNREGLVGFLVGGRDAWLERDTNLAPLKYDPSGHDLVVLAGPVWAFTVCPAIRAYLKLCGSRIRAAACIATQGGRGAERTFAAMEELLGRPSVAKLTLLDRDIDKGAHEAALQRFAAELQGTPTATPAAAPTAATPS